MKLSELLYLCPATVCWDKNSTKPANSSYLIISPNGTVSGDWDSQVGKGRDAFGSHNSSSSSSCRSPLLKWMSNAWECKLDVGSSSSLLRVLWEVRAARWLVSWSRGVVTREEESCSFVETSQLGHTQAHRPFQQTEPTPFSLTSPNSNPFSCSRSFHKSGSDRYV